MVKNIARKEDKPPETRSDDEIRDLLRAKGAESMQGRVDQKVDEEVKKVLLDSCDVNADKVMMIMMSTTVVNQNHARTESSRE